MLVVLDVDFQRIALSLLSKQGMLQKNQGIDLLKKIIALFDGFASARTSLFVPDS